MESGLQATMTVVFCLTTFPRLKKDTKIVLAQTDMYLNTHA
jgi:hypothetical protein